MLESYKDRERERKYTHVFRIQEPRNGGIVSTYIQFIYPLL